MDRLSEIRARCEAATPGPWMWDVNSHCKEISLHGTRWPMNIVMNFVRYGMGGAAPRFNVDGIMKRADEMLKSYPGKEHHHGFDDYIDHPDADFIAHARDDIPYLLARLEKAEAENRWIPVEERLPTEAESRDKATGELIPLLVCVEGTEYPFRAFYDGKSWGDGWSKISTTHWRPLPEPPKGE